MATVGGGLLMYAVHLLNKKIPEREYSVFGVLLAVAMFVPNMPLQMVFAQQTARALATGRERELAGMIRLAWLGTFGLWLLVAVPALIFQGAILARWQITNPAGLWLVLPTILFSLWLPMFSGVMQGQQNFFWLGWQNIINAAGRLGLAAIAVLAFGGYAAGMFTGVCVGLGAAAGICIWQTRGLWSLPTAPFDRQNLLAQIIPLMLGFSAVQFFLSADTMFVQAYFPAGQTAFYVGAGTLSRALMWVVVPLATVMFPKIVHAEARAEKSNLLKLVLLGTAILAAGGAAGLCVVGPFVVKLIYKGSYLAVASSLLPWYAWAMVPLALANVLVNDLMARSRFRIVPALLLLVGGYAFALTRFHDNFVMVLKTLGAFNLLLLGVCAWFAWGKRGR
jgi:O-antigen/teichoic acid export membrane protein